MKIISTLVTALVVLLLTESCTESKGNHASVPKTSEPIPVRVITLAKSTYTDEVRASGRLTTDNETLLSFKSGGIVKRILVEEGQKISRGQILALIDLTEIDATVTQAEAAYEKASRDLSRVENLYKDSVATLEQLQNSQTARDVAFAQLSTVKFNRGFSEIKAPADGFVLHKYVNAGQLVGSGDPILKTNGAASGEWIVKTGVTDKQWAAIKIGDPATVKLDAFPSESFEAKVIRKSESVDPTNGAFTVELALREGKKHFAPGLFASATILTGQTKTAWEVPYEAVLDASGNHGFVFITNDNEMAIRKSVVIGSFGDSSIRIDEGLEDTLALIVSGSAYLRDNTPITVVK